MTVESNDFKEMHPPTNGEKKGSGFTPLYAGAREADNSFSEMYIGSDSNGIKTKTDESSEINQDVGTSSAQEQQDSSEVWLPDDSTASADSEIASDQDDDMQAVWDDGYAAGATESGSIEANKYAKQLAVLRREYESALKSITFGVSDIELSESIVDTFKNYCKEISTKLFGGSINEDLDVFIADKVSKFSAEIKENEPVVKVYVSQCSFDKLKHIGATCVGDAIQLGENCFVYASTSVTDLELCKVVAEVDGKPIKADLNIESVKREVASIADSVFGSDDSTSLNIADPEQDAIDGKMSSDSRESILKLMSSSLDEISSGDMLYLNGVNIDDMHAREQKFSDFNENLK